MDKSMKLCVVALCVLVPLLIFLLARSCENGVQRIEAHLQTLVEATADNTSPECERISHNFLRAWTDTLYTCSRCMKRAR